MKKVGWFFFNCDKFFLFFFPGLKKKEKKSTLDIFFPSALPLPPLLPPSLSFVLSTSHFLLPATKSNRKPRGETRG